jgi:DHA2 family multidrug resistance protein
VLFFAFGVGLFGSTTLIPQILQSLYGYRAIDAGLVLGPGALVISMLAPVSAQLIQRKIIHPKTLVMFSVSIIGAALWHYNTFTLATDYRHYVLARAFQGFGYGFFFVPISVISYSQLRPDQNNRASSLTNFFRNWGGSFGIALITTVAERRQQFHQTNLGSAISATSQQFTARTQALADAALAAQGSVFHQLQHQVNLLAFMDAFRILAWVTLTMIPVLFAIRYFKPAGKPPTAH